MFIFAIVAVTLASVLCLLSISLFVYLFSQDGFSMIDTEAVVGIVCFLASPLLALVVSICLLLETMK